MRAADLLTENITLLSDNMAQERFGLSVPPALLSRIWLAWCLAETGAFREGITRAAEAGRLAEQTGRRLDLVYALRAPLLVHLGKGDVGLVVSLGEELLQLSRADDLAVGRPTAAAALGYARALSGRFDDAHSCLDEALRSLTSAGMQVARPLYVAWRSEVLGLQGLLDEAAEQGQQALALARAGRYRGYEAWALRLLAELASRKEPPTADASMRFREALTLANELGMRPLVAHCHLGLGKLHLRTDKRERAREHFATATAMYREMGMTYWLERTEAEMRELR